MVSGAPRHIQPPYRYRHLHTLLVLTVSSACSRRKTRILGINKLQQHWVYPNQPWMDDSALRQLFDLIVLGTGHTESIVAAAAAKSGKTVLHLDAEDHYGGVHAALSLRQLEELAFLPTPSSVAEGTHPVTPPSNPRTFVASVLHAPNDGLEFSEAPARLPDSLRKIASRFTVDLIPSLILSTGRTVEAMRGSGAASYAEFKSLESAWVVDTAEAATTVTERGVDGGALSPEWIFHKVIDSLASTGRPVLSLWAWLLSLSSFRCRRPRQTCFLRPSACWRSAN